MADINLGTADGSTLGNPPSGTFYFFNDSNNSNAFTRRDSAGVDQVYVFGLPPSFSVDLDSAESTVSRAFAGGRTTFTVTHSLGTLDIKPEVFRLSDGRTMGWRIERTGLNTIEASRTGNVSDGLFRVVI